MSAIASIRKVGINAPPLAVLQLRSPVMLTGGSVSQLVFRRPTAADVVELGFPYFVMQEKGGNGFHFKPKTILRYVARLTGVKESALAGLDIDDLQSCKVVVINIFTQAGPLASLGDVQSSGVGEQHV